MFKFTVIMPITAKVETVLRLLGTHHIILKRKNHWNTMFQFYYIWDDFLVLKGHMTFMKLVFTASDNVRGGFWGFGIGLPPLMEMGPPHGGEGVTS